MAIHRFARRLLAGEPIPRYGYGSSEGDCTYIDDLLNGIEAALAWLGENGTRYTVTNLGSDRTVRLSEMIDTLGDVASFEPEI